MLKAIVHTGLVGLILYLSWGFVIYPKTGVDMNYLDVLIALLAIRTVQDSGEEVLKDWKTFIVEGLVPKLLIVCLIFILAYIN